MASIAYDDDIFCQDIAVLVPTVTSGEASPDSLASLSSGAETKKRRRPTVLDELKYLRAKHDELSTQLEQLRAITSIVPIERKRRSKHCMKMGSSKASSTTR
ncbi:hypothetical protein SDRG_14013 [Saprolegnia diclina VS20]|uniref:Uncharacterized protein n=1 Tax=Saprolegnia diclina (strain VS20) TaxID=1156394 RepID=T0PRR9_SAPDV|nr:hypothetical protein SDRG_14013 [Saprolegnia diclina VS20]EQC28189.1 hypothetical protein SDRG_14013 [Saprolegnia diclina VS20]|eukprot:XP_008618338.1 hypothetical protein SDRG_14013 [Saprolegnia diclina VS20]